MPGIKIFSVTFLVPLIACILAPVPVRAQIQVNLPYFGSQSRMNEAAIFWFGEVGNQKNYADVRTGYTDTGLSVYLHIIDRYLWYNPTPSASDLASWDAVSLYLDTGQAPGTAISPKSYRFTGGLDWWENDQGFQAGYQGTNTQTWLPLNLPLITESAWRGDAPNNLIDDRGWTMFFTIPFTLLNAAPPSAGAVWHLGLILHDRDNATTPEPATVWPPGFAAIDPTTWGTIRFGLPVVSPPPSQNPTTYTIRQDSQHQVVDAHVGGHADCGAASGPDYFPTWGYQNYTGYTQITEQNQWDIADWPCFSKMLFKFPLTSLPPGKVVTKATLTLHQFGNSDPAQATPSYLQVLTASSVWDEATVTWNNAPLPLENVSAAWVSPVSGPLVWPGWQRDWDVTYGFAKTYAGNAPTFSIILYSADADYHSGKYFTSSDIEDWDLAGRPTLTLELADSMATRAGDFNGDTHIDTLDWLLLWPHFGTNDPVLNLSGNAFIDIFDVNRFLKLFGN